MSASQNLFMEAVILFTKAIGKCPRLKASASVNPFSEAGTSVASHLSISLVCYDLYVSHKG